ncbi:MAG: hypothetical protein NC218_01870 [Acetobacter sp.]|nr:hypothetical protein [Acetobacter sp.]
MLDNNSISQKEFKQVLTHYVASAYANEHRDKVRRVKAQVADNSTLFVLTDKDGKETFHTVKDFEVVQATTLKEYIELYTAKIDDGIYRDSVIEDTMSKEGSESDAVRALIERANQFI